MKYIRFLSKRLITPLNLICCTILLIQAIIPPPAIARRRCSLENIEITEIKGDLRASFKVTGAFTDKMSDAVLKGVPASFSFFISVYRKRDAWFDENIVDIKLSATLKYNSIKQDFTVLRPWKTDKPFTTTSFDEAKEMASTVSNTKVLSLNNFEQGEEYEIKIKAEMNKATLPLYLHYVFFFISYWDFETDWYSFDKRY
ncbi:MAG: DUF4390 domain-containing protein [Desulfamplus sp.]|nr:DUF4390 domain-containing protein [Desulfamplus sp.]